jgi:hypothetical protein
MANLGQHFDATSVDPNAGFPVIPPGTYVVQIIESEMRATKDGTGQFLRLVHEVCDGPHAGKKITNNLNLINANQQTVDIAQRHLSQICHAVGVMSVSDSEQLHMKRMMAEVAVMPPKGQFGESNAVRRYLAIGASSPPTHSAAPAAAVAAKPAGASPPWRTRAA